MNLSLRNGTSTLGNFSSDFSAWRNNTIIAKLVIISLILMTSLVGNSLVLVVVYRNANNRMRCVSNAFIVNVASCDLSMTLFNLLQAIVVIFTNDVWRVEGLLGLVLCGLCRLMWFASIDVSMLSLLAVAVDRFLLVFFPTKKVISNNVSYIMIASMWFVGIVFSIPRVSGTRLLELANARYCASTYSNFEAFRSYILAHFIIFVTLPLITMVALHSAILFKLGSHVTPGNPSNATQESRDRHNRKIFVMLVALVVLFAACWLPYWYGLLACQYFRRCPGWPFHYITLLMAYSNTALNPCAYAMFNENFRAEFRRIAKATLCPTCVRTNLSLRRNHVIEINIELACAQLIRMMSVAGATGTLSLSRLDNIVN